jgi:hypothetical protein
LCRNRTSSKDARDKERAEALLKLTNQLEHCMPWERRDILMQIRALKKGSTD